MCWDGVTTGLTLGVGKVEGVLCATDFTRGNRCAMLAQSARISSMIGARISCRTRWGALYNSLRWVLGEWPGLGVYGGASVDVVAENVGGRTGYCGVSGYWAEAE